MSELRPLSTSVAHITRQSFAKKFVALARILEYWPDIIGKDYAARAQPLKLSYRKPKTKDDKPSATLHIMAEPADATALHYQSGLILERINHVFGDSWVNKVKFEPLVLGQNNPFLQEFTPSRDVPPLNEAQKSSLKTVLDEISDPELRLRLEKLGEGVLRKQHLK